MMQIPPLQTFVGNGSLALSKGEVSRFQVQCDALLALLKHEGESSTAEEVQRIAVRLTWAFFYSRKGSATEEHERLLAVYLATLEQLHDIWLDTEKVKLVEEKIITVTRPGPAMSQPDFFSMPRDPEQAAISLSPEDV